MRKRKKNSINSSTVKFVVLLLLPSVATIYKNVLTLSSYGIAAVTLRPQNIMSHEIMSNSQYTETCSSH